MKPATNTGLLLSRHSHCANCGSPIPHANYGQRFCDQWCRAEGKASEQRAARKFWRAMGRPTEEEVERAT
jgi:predicted nucleic acid-binding Zn ribbon protein